MCHFPRAEKLCLYSGVISDARLHLLAHTGFSNAHFIERSRLSTDAIGSIHGQVIHCTKPPSRFDPIIATILEIRYLILASSLEAAWLKSGCDFLFQLQSMLVPDSRRSKYVRCPLTL
jgi:hypothetical protein